MSKVNLRSANAQKLTVEQADESLVHLSRITEVTTATQLNTGGSYRSVGTFSLTMPADGNYVEILVASGTPTLVGTIDGISSPVIQPGATRKYVKVGTAWQVLSGSGSGGLGSFATYTGNATASTDFPMLWFDNTANAVLTLPVGLPENTTFGVVRGGTFTLTVDPSGSEGIIDPATGTPNVDGVFLNEIRKVLWLKKGVTHWSAAT